ncbi:uncharacterized protein SPAPADRAFT_134192 [Spathaspora passalidarum NRRL Y-27907]|uniref:LAA1-like C-terminal TPR repeats domain-containing protein n=1 Tax=Spathaspora passalidarum (strain NRRL Y-27907 / 11-Y1) TaxID=619300 RepID=G3AIZ4_SPAPN|nr:uncharacterized protein SPAPADRAFT_134192 [Spathaspora passalidarum NRRL Y-27907]EGW34506.1 hypothetical protein SPAPADRAFT_134192 [Spathaspora passalidarum NRRL Y-27907]
MERFTDIITRFDKSEIFNYLTTVNSQLLQEDADYEIYLGQLQQLITKITSETTSKPKKKDSVDDSEARSHTSLNLYRSVSKNLVLVLQKLTTKVYDVANALLNNLQLEGAELSLGTDVSILVLIDLFESFPNQLGALINFSVSQVHKILKKNPNISSNLVFLLNSITKNATRLDIDEKMQGRLMKIVTKAITSETISYELYESEDNDGTSTVLLKKNYILCCKNLLLLAISTSYEGLLAVSTSSSSAGAKMKPEVIMSNQHQFQTNLLSSNEKYFTYGLSNYSKEVRIAMVELLSNVMMNLVPTGKFTPIEYLITLYPLPSYNLWNDSLTAQIDDEEIAEEPDSESAIASALETTLTQSSVIEAIIFYLQLEQFQNPEFLSQNLLTILDLILSKFGDVEHNHIQNQPWVKTLKHWSTLIEYLVQETGLNCHEMLTRYVYGKFSPDSEDVPKKSTTKERKRESRLFTFKSKSSKSKRDLSDQEAKPYHNSYQTYWLLFIIEMLLPYGVNFDAIVQNKEKTEDPEEPKDEDDLDLEKPHEETASFVRDILFRLIVNDNYYIRNYALQSLLVYAHNNEVEINQLILYAFRLVDQEYHHVETNATTGPSADNICGISSVKLLSYSLALSSLIKQTNSNLLQNSTIVKVLSFCTQNLKHNINPNKNTSCWVILSSLVTLYNSSEYVRLNSSQLLVFWKSLLTSQYMSNAADVNAQTQEILVNLKLRNFSLICLLNYLNSVELTPESLKQIQFLLTKSYNYLSYLESTVPAIGSITSFNTFNEYEYNVNMLNNLLYTNYSFNNKLSQDKILTSLILYCKKLLLESFARLATLLKNDINSNMIIFLIKVFSDGKLFARIQSDPDKGKSKSKPVRVSDYYKESIVLNDEDKYCYGVTSKYQGTNIDELLIKFPLEAAEKDVQWIRSTFTNTVTAAPKTSIENEDVETIGAWFDYFEKLSFKSVVNSINYDPTILLTQDYSTHHRYATNLITSLIDISIELFQLVFPYLSSKIQFSLLEQIRNSLTAKPIDPLRSSAIRVNTAIALHGVLSNMKKKKLTSDESIILVIIDIIKKLNLKDESIIKINADTIGLASQFLNVNGVAGQISGFINDIVTDSNPYNRGFSILSLCSIYEGTKIGFGDIYSISIQLMNDPNPIIAHFTLVGVVKLFESNLENNLLIPTVLNKLYSNYLNDGFGYDIETNVLVNLKTKFGSVGPMSKLLQLFVTSLGPAIRDSNETERNKLKSLIIALSQGIGLATLDEYCHVYKNLLRLFQELIIFDPNLLEGEITFFTELLNLIISKNLKISLASVSPTSLNVDAIFPFNTSFDLYCAAYECYYELLKIFGVDILTKETINLLWVSMNVRPCDQLKQFIKLWLETSLDKNWFTILNSLFRLSSKKLMGGFLESNYQHKLLPLSQRQKKNTSASVNFKDEEIENIVRDSSEEDDKNEPISWEFKLYIYELLNHLLRLANKNSQLIDKLKPKIQEIVKLSFIGSTSSITQLKIHGIELLDRALKLFGDLPDPLYPGVSILEQQQAQIISALIPCFTPGNDYKVIVDAINVSSKFINLPRINFYSKQRILKTLIYLLEEISSNKFLRFGFLETMSEFGRKSIQLSILNCWAVLRIDAYEDNEIEPEFLDTLDKYSSLLTSLWILVLREFSVLKYSDSSNKQLEIYGDYWINFISVLSLELENNSNFIEKYLGGNDATNFFFILFSQCVESLIRNKNVAEILVSLNRLVKIKELVDLLFNDEIFGEVIDLFDRLMLIDEDTEIQCDLVDIISTIFQTFIKSHDEIESGFDKLFELIRVEMLPLFRVLPFLRYDYDPTNKSNQLLLKHADSAPNLLVLKKTLETLIEMVGSLPDVVKADLYGVLLYIFAKIYESKNSLLISIIIPHLKNVVVESKKVGCDLISTFDKTIKNYFDIDENNNYSVITVLILITNGDVKLTPSESEKLSNALLQLLESADTAPTAIRCIKSLIQYSVNQKEDVLTIKYLITELLKHVSNKEKNIDVKVAFEILMLFTRLLDEAKKTALYTILIPLLLKYNEQDVIPRVYLHEKLIFLVQQSPASFKQVINTLSDTQKQLTEELVKLTPEHKSADPFEEGEEIQLKTFGV